MNKKPKAIKGEIIDKKDIPKNIRDLYKKYEGDNISKDPGFHDWQKDIFLRIRERLVESGDYEAVILYDYTINFAKMKSYYAKPR